MALGHFQGHFDHCIIAHVLYVVHELAMFPTSTSFFVLMMVFM